MTFLEIMYNFHLPSVFGSAADKTGSEATSSAITITLSNILEYLRWGLTELTHNSHTLGEVANSKLNKGLVSLAFLFTRTLTE